MTQTDEFESLRGQVSSLRRQHRALLFLVALSLAMTLVASVLLLRRAPEPTVINDQRHLLARTVTIVDDAGRVRMQLGELADGRFGLIVRDRSDVARAGLVLDNAGSVSLTLWDERSRGMVGLGLNADRNSGIQFANPSGQGGAWMGVRPDGEPFMLFQDSTATDRVRIRVGADGGASLAVFGPERRGNVLLLASDIGPGLSMSDLIGGILVDLHVNERGVPYLKLEDRQGRIRLLSR